MLLAELLRACSQLVGVWETLWVLKGKVVRTSSTLGPSSKRGEKKNCEIYRLEEETWMKSSPAGNKKTRKALWLLRGIKQYQELGRSV